MKRILIVDDDPLILEMVEAVLDNPAFDVHTAGGADAALAWAAGPGGGIDLLITDFSMPGMNGEQLGLRIESLFPGVPVLLVSGRPDDVRIARAHPGWRFLKKPFNIMDLSNEVSALLDHAG